MASPNQNAPAQQVIAQSLVRRGEWDRSAFYNEALAPSALFTDRSLVAFMRALNFNRTTFSVLEWKSGVILGLGVIASQLDHRPAKAAVQLRWILTGQLLIPVARTQVKPGGISLVRIRELLIAATNFLTNNNAWTVDVVAADGTAINMPAVPDQFADITEVHSHLEAMEPHVSGRSIPKPAELLVLAYVSCIKRGTASESFIEKVVVGMSQDVGLSISITSDDVQTVFYHYCHGLTSEMISEIATLWAATLPAHALRLRLIVERAHGAGATGVVIVGKAMKLCRDFNWAYLRGAPGYDVEMTYVDTAIRELIRNPYAGYDEGQARVTNHVKFRNVSYIAKKLLVDFCGEHSLRNYKGCAQSPRDPAMVESLFDQYRQVVANATDVTAPLPPANTQAQTDLINAIANNGLFA